MKIAFDINMEKKIITFFFKNGELRQWVKKGMKDCPDLTTDELAKNGSENLTFVIFRTMEKAFEKLGLEKEEVYKFTPKMISYQNKSELPPHIREM